MKVKSLQELIKEAATWAEPPAQRGPGRPQNPDVLRAAQMVVLFGWGEAGAAKHCGVQYPAVRAAAKRLREEQARQWNQDRVKRWAEEDKKAE